MQIHRARQRTTRRREVERLLAARKKALHVLLPHQHVGARAGPPRGADMVHEVVRQHLVVRRDPARDVAAGSQVRAGDPAGGNDVDEDEQLLCRRVDVDVTAGLVLAVPTQLQRLVAPHRACSRP